MKSHFPYAVTAVFFASLASGHFDWAVLEIAIAVLAIPCVYAEEADELEKNRDKS